MIGLTRAKKILCAVLFVGIIMGCFSPEAFAGSPESKSLSEKDTQMSLTTESDDARGNEYVSRTLTGSDAVLSFQQSIGAISRSSNDSGDRTNSIEELFGCDIDISSAFEIFDTVTGDMYTRYISSDKAEISFDENGEIFKISTIYADEESATRTVASMQEVKDACLDMMDELYCLLDIDVEYTLTEVYDFDQDYVFFTFEKEISSGLTNPLQSVNVVFDKNDLRFSIAVKFNYSPNATAPIITVEDALSVARGYTTNEVTVDDVELTYLSEIMYAPIAEQYNNDYCYLVYRILPANDCDIIYIDALTGEYIGRDMLLGETGFSVAIQESKDPSAYSYNSVLLNYTDADVTKYNSWFYNKANLAVAAMRRLGYSATASYYSTSQMITDIEDYLQALSNEYAFFFSGHGSKSVIGFHSKGWITHSDVTGNWHFVFLDACSTAVDTGWADAFKINGYSDRAFLGWSNSIAYNYSYLFAQKFWPLINGSNTVRQAAVDAAAEVPGSGTTPIRFYGDTSYTGEAWS